FEFGAADENAEETNAREEEFFGFTTDTTDTAVQSESTGGLEQEHTSDEPNQSELGSEVAREAGAPLPSWWTEDEPDNAPHAQPEAYEQQIDEGERVGHDSAQAEFGSFNSPLDDLNEEDNTFATWDSEGGEATDDHAGSELTNYGENASNVEDLGDPISEQAEFVQEEAEGQNAQPTEEESPFEQGTDIAEGSAESALHEPGYAEHDLSPGQTPAAPEQNFASSDLGIDSSQTVDAPAALNEGVQGQASVPDESDQVGGPPQEQDLEGGGIVAPEEDDDSIEDYMKQLLARMRGDSSQPKRPKPESPQEISEDTIEHVDLSAAPEEAENALSEEYSPRVFAPEKVQSLAAMRELANTTARTAIHKSSQQRDVRDIVLKGSITVIGLLVGSVLLALNGLSINLVLIGTVTAFAFSIIWGVDAANTLRAILSGKPARKSKSPKISGQQPVQQDQSGPRVAAATLPLPQQDPVEQE
ncbi:MAG: hypothetical protein AAF483_29180, partial [Planctomycetota bacterium]